MKKKKKEVIGDFFRNENLINQQKCNNGKNTPCGGWQVEMC
jgi:hypothetical protein